MPAAPHLTKDRNVASQRECALSETSGVSDPAGVDVPATNAVQCTVSSAANSNMALPLPPHSTTTRPLLLKGTMFLSSVNVNWRRRFVWYLIKVF